MVRKQALAAASHWVSLRPNVRFYVVRVNEKPSRVLSHRPGCTLLFGELPQECTVSICKEHADSADTTLLVLKTTRIIILYVCR